MSNDFDDIDPFADDETDLDGAQLKPSDSVTNTDDEELMFDEKRRALDAWNSGETSLLKIIQAAAGPGVTGRHKKGKAIKIYLAGLSIKPTPSQEYVKKSDSFELKEAHKEYIRAHAQTNKPLEIARELFDNPTMTNLSTEARAVLKFYNTLDVNLRFVKDNENEEDLGKYVPPRKHENAIARINRYVYEGIDANNLTQRDKHCLNSLIKYCNVHRYIYTINELNSARDRELFESSFIRYVYDKPDVSEEEIDMYINLCCDVVNLTRMQRELEVLIETRDQVLEETGKMSMAIVTEIGNLRSEMGDNQKRQKSVYEALQGKRSDRLKNRIAENASVLKLVDLWKNETKRKQLIQIADARKKDLKETVDRLDNLDAVRFQLWGFGKDEAVNY